MLLPELAPPVSTNDGITTGNGSGATLARFIQPLATSKLRHGYYMYDGHVGKPFSGSHSRCRVGTPL
jgi:hypothetical protein